MPEHAEQMGLTSTTCCPLRVQAILEWQHHRSLLSNSLRNLAPLKVLEVGACMTDRSGF